MRTLIVISAIAIVLVVFVLVILRRRRRYSDLRDIPLSVCESSYSDCRESALDDRETGDTLYGGLVELDSSMETNWTETGLRKPGKGIVISLAQFIERLFFKLSAKSSSMTKPDPVCLAASAPQSVRPGDHFTARFVAYVEELEQEIEARLVKLSPRSAHHLRVKSCRWKAGTRVKVRLYGNQMIVGEAEQDFIWEGQSNLLDFDVEVPPDAPQLTTVLKFDVLIDAIVIGRLRLDLEIGQQTKEETRTVKGEPARSAFASYASKDRQRVLDRVSEIQRNGVDVFLDCLSLHPGQKWKARLEQEIVRRELFLLFWSVNAKRSKWVTWEWRTALKHRGLEGIEPHPLDPVDVAPPPQELSDLHFGDPHMLIRAAYERPTKKAE